MRRMAYAFEFNKNPNWLSRDNPTRFEIERSITGFPESQLFLQ